MVGKLVAGRYHLVRLLGDGGMGAVYKAADQVLRRFVAIKMLHPAVAENPSSVERFQREARAAAAIGHPNIIDIMDFGTEGSRPYMVMEYLRGRSLSQVIAMDGQLPIKRAATIAIHTLAGLQGAHDRGILHRDLKPANLMLVVRLGDRNFVKVCDFGFAALLDRSRTDAKALTPERTLVGTPAYAAPERLRGDDKRDPRLDVYSVGVVLYEMLAGRRPFDAPTFRDLARKVKNDPPPPLTDARADIPLELEAIVLKALAKDREERWESAESFAEALFAYGGLRTSFEGERPSDSFTMEMMRIKARESRHRETHSGIPVPDVSKALAAKPLLRPKAPEPPKQPAPARPRAEPLKPVATRIEPSKARKSAAHPSLASDDEGDHTLRMSFDEAREALEALGQRAAELGKPRKSTSSVDIPIVVEAPVAQADIDKTIPEEKIEERRDATVRTPSPTAYSGRLVLAILRFVSRKFGERALREVLAAMPADTRGVFDAGIGEDSWVDLEVVRSFIEEVDRRLGQDDLQFVLEAGRAAAEGAFDMMQSLRPPAPPPELLVAEMPSILGKVVRGVRCEVKRVGRGYGRLELDEQQEPSLTLAVGTLGFVARSLERFGAEDVEVNLLSARALDDPETLIDISWFA